MSAVQPNPTALHTHLLVEVVLGCGLPLEACHDGHLEDLDHVGAVRGGDEEERELALGGKVEALGRDLKGAG